MLAAVFSGSVVSGDWICSLNFRAVSVKYSFISGLRYLVSISVVGFSRKDDVIFVF